MFVGLRDDDFVKRLYDCVKILRLKVCFVLWLSVAPEQIKR